MQAILDGYNAFERIVARAARDGSWRVALGIVRDQQACSELDFATSLRHLVLKLNYQPEQLLARFCVNVYVQLLSRGALSEEATRVIEDSPTATSGSAGGNAEHGWDPGRTLTPFADSNLGTRDWGKLIRQTQSDDPATRKHALFTACGRNDTARGAPMQLADFAEDESRQCANFARSVRNILVHSITRRELPAEPGTIFSCMLILAELEANRVGGPAPLPSVASLQRHGLFGLPLREWAVDQVRALLPLIQDPTIQLAIGGAAIERTYRSAVASRYGQLPAPGGPLSVATGYVARRLVPEAQLGPAYVTPHEAQEENGPGERSPLVERVVRRHGVVLPWEVIVRHPSGVVILGEAGSGKTALMSYLAWRCATEAGAPLPLLLRASDLQLHADGTIDLGATVARSLA